MNTHQAPSFLGQIPYGGTTINVVVVEKSGCKYGFASNDDWQKDDIKLVDKIFRQYGKRWSIETGYQVKKETFRARKPQRTIP